jgi:low affinity Fe/Cu permease
VELRHFCHVGTVLKPQEIKAEIQRMEEEAEKTGDTWTKVAMFSVWDDFSDGK